MSKNDLIEVKLKDAFELQMGKTPARNNSQYWDGNNKWISIADIGKAGKFISDTKECITDSAVAKSGIKAVPKGTLIMSFKLSIGKTAITAEDMFTNEAIMAFIDKGVYDIDINYLYHYFTSMDWSAGSNKAVMGMTLNKATLSEKKIRIPDVKTQKAIACRLDKVEELINIKKEEFEKIETLIKARFVELFGDMKTNPNSYEVVRFEDCIEYMGDIGSNGANSVVVEHLDMKDEEDYALMVRFLNFTKNDFTDDVKYVSKEAYDFLKKSQIFGGELIICKIGSAGQNYVMPYLNRPVSLGLNQIMVRINKKVLMPYMYQYLHTEYGQMLIDSCINGAVTKSITKTELKKIPVVIPPIELQKQFTAFVEQTDKSKLIVKKQLEELETLKRSLIQKYFG